MAAKFRHTSILNETHMGGLLGYSGVSMHWHLLRSPAAIGLLTRAEKKASFEVACCVLRAAMLPCRASQRPGAAGEPAPALQHPHGPRAGWCA